MRLELKWQAILEDGGQVDESDGGSVKVLFEQGLCIKEFRLIDYFPWRLKTGEVLSPRVFLSISLEHNQRLIYRRRHWKQTGGMNPTDKRSTIVGFQETRQGVNFQSVLLIHEWTGFMEFLPRFKPEDKLARMPWEKEAGMEVTPDGIYRDGS